MKDREQVINALSRAGKRALIHMIQAAIEGVKAVEAVIDELGKMDNNDEEEQSSTAAERIEVE
ncbi:MAG TPA: hypothetical protein VMO52_10050 [Acidimicrobiia bacterium]|nr:hypothetical protein [Acidimicrobiia bacterium]